MIEKFDVKKLERQLKKINKDNNIEVAAGIQIILNNCEVYNNLVDNVDYNSTKSMYLIFQVSANIFNNLKEFGIFPDKKKTKDDDDDKLTAIKQKLEKR